MTNLFVRLARGLESRAESSPSIRFVRAETEDVMVSHLEFLGRAAVFGQKLSAMSEPGTRAIMIGAGDPTTTLLTFCAALSAGIPPLILPGPKALGGVEQFQAALDTLIERFDRKVLFSGEPGHGFRTPNTPSMSVSFDSEESSAGERDAAMLAAVDVEHPANGVSFLQMTSASTGTPKIVAISADNFTTNVEDLLVALDVQPDDHMGAWLPLYHDMGLVGTCLLSLYGRLDLSIMRPNEFIMRPERWIDMLSSDRCTITAAPNFGYDYAARFIPEATDNAWDLSSLRRAVVGAEPIRPATLRGFAERFARFGFRGGALTPSYGMAECTLGTTMEVEGVPASYLRIDPTATTTGSPVRLFEGADISSEPDQTASGSAIVRLGTPLGRTTLRLIDDSGLPVLDDDVLGEVTVSGPSVSLGYFDPGTGRPVPFEGGVLRTGDLGFLHDDSLYLVDRRKHVIIRNGQNYLASVVEEQVGRILGHPAHELMALETDLTDPSGELWVLTERRRSDAQLTQEQLIELRRLDLSIDAVAFARKRVIPRTTSGKKRYVEARRQLAAGVLHADSVVRVRP